MATLTEDQFDDQFTVLPDAQGETIRPTFDGTPEDSTNLWTVLDLDGSLYAVSGLHYVNRIGYLLTEEAWTQDTEALWIEASDEDDAVSAEEDGRETNNA